VDGARLFQQGAAVLCGALGDQLEAVFAGGGEGGGDSDFEGARFVDRDRRRLDGRAVCLADKEEARLAFVRRVRGNLEAGAVYREDFPPGRGFVHEARRLVHGPAYEALGLDDAVKVDVDVVFEVVDEGRGRQETRQGVHTGGKAGFRARVLAADVGAELEERGLDPEPVRDEVADEFQGGGEALLDDVGAGGDAVDLGLAGDGVDVQFALVDGLEGVGLLRAGQEGADELDGDSVHDVFDVEVEGHAGLLYLGNRDWGKGKSEHLFSLYSHPPAAPPCRESIAWLMRAVVLRSK